MAGSAEVNVAGVHFQRVVEGRVDQFHHAAGVFADAGQRQALQGIDFVVGIALGVQRFDRVEAFFVAGQIGLEVIGVHQMQRRAVQAIVDPGQPRRVEGVGKHADDFVVVAQQDEFTFEALCEGDPVKYRRRLKQAVGVEHRVMQGGAEGVNERHRRQFTEYAKGFEDAFAGGGGPRPGLGKLFTGKALGGAFGQQRFDDNGQTFHGLLSNRGLEPCRRGKPWRQVPERLFAPLLPGEHLIVVRCHGVQLSSPIRQHPTAIVQLQREALGPALASFDEALGRARTGFRFALDAQKVADSSGQFRQWKRFEQDVADLQLPRPLTDFSGRVTCYQHKITRPVLADRVEHLKAFHIGQAVIEHQHVGGKAFGQADRRRSVVCNPDVQPLRRQIILKVLCKQLFVFDNQYFVNQGRLLETAGPMTPP
ncbi:hypothetical protein D3C81_893410 [compost metagenome]